MVSKVDPNPTKKFHFYKPYFYYTRHASTF
jgi:hypothetical protein